MTIRIVVLGGGFGGVTVTRELEQLLSARHSDIELTLVSRENSFVLTPLLFEACSGVLELRHCAQPIRPALRRARFVEATVHDVDVESRVVHAVGLDGRPRELPYDHLIVALGADTNRALIPGSDAAFTFKSMTDAVTLRNHLIERFERADVELDAERRQALLTVVIVGGGLVGVELLGELTAFADDILRYYPRIHRDEVKFHLFEASDRILPEVDPKLAALTKDVLDRRGADIRTATRVSAIEPGVVRVGDRMIETDTVVLAAGIVPSKVASQIGVTHDRRGRIAVDATMRSVSHVTVWALDDCAAIPDSRGGFYPALAQHTVREARQVARNVAATIRGRTPTPFVYSPLGTMASLGHTRAVVQIFGLHLTGFIAWWMRRTYYLFQMPQWNRRFRIVLDWTVALFFRPDITKVEVVAPPRQNAETTPLLGMSVHSG